MPYTPHLPPFNRVPELLGGSSFPKKPVIPVMMVTDIPLTERVRAFQEQLRTWTGSGVPLLTLPGSPTPRHGQCVSCGESIVTGWRCAVYLEAVYVALGVTPPEAA